MLISVSMRTVLILDQVAGVLRFERLFYRLLTHVIEECCLPLKDYAAHILLLITVSSILMLRSGLGGPSRGPSCIFATARKSKTE